MDSLRRSDPGPIEETTHFSPRFDQAGLIPCITVDAADGLC
jgi:hypothetical protein